jgi:hypothetical protein
MNVKYYIIGSGGKNIGKALQALTAYFLKKTV